MTVVPLLALVVGFSPDSVCSLGTNLKRQSVDQIAVLAVFTGEILQVPVPDEPLYRETLPSSLATVAAYRFTVKRATSSLSESSEASSFLVVPWDYDEACDPLVWSQPDWIPVGREVVFMGSPNRGTTGGEPILDLSGWHSPYPYAETLRIQEAKDVRSPREEWLPPDAYFKMLAALPAAPSGLSQPEALKVIESVFANGDPRWRSSFPGREILRRAREERR
jgi:hypothetical protein